MEHLLLWLILTLEPYSPPNLVEQEKIVSHGTSIECSCVAWAHSKDSRIPLQDAALFKGNGQPTIGGLVLFYYPNSDEYHVAIIKSFTGNGAVVSEANYRPCASEDREVVFNDRVIGFWNPPDIAATAVALRAKPN